MHYLNHLLEFLLFNTDYHHIRFIIFCSVFILQLYYHRNTKKLFTITYSYEWGEGRDVSTTSFVLLLNTPPFKGRYSYHMYLSPLNVPIQLHRVRLFCSRGTLTLRFSGDNSPFWNSIRSNHSTPVLLFSSYIIIIL